MTINIPVEVLDERCKHCPEFKPYLDYSDLWAGDQHISRDFRACQCEHLQLCKRLRHRVREE